MKATLEFNLPEESEDHNDALNGTKSKIIIDDIWNILFRPRHKHGYRDIELQELVDTEIGEKLMDKLEKLYHNVINDEE